ncbi:hypothetical protein, partial [Bifidobacterium vespertilionis]|uniref:hypothetical protein n=1 Tax=Bifidobacterium vespertilionis TaxID=2562524 RepID=UPI00168AEC49
MAVSGGVATANADDYPNYNYDVKATASNARVSEVGAHTANVTFDWKIDLPADQIKSVCAVEVITRITDITPIENRETAYGGGGPYDASCTGTPDTELTPDLYDQFYGVHEQNLDLPADDSNYYTAATYTMQDVSRYWNTWDGKSNSGTFFLPLIGLTPNTTYGNTKGNRGDHEDNHPSDPWWWAASKFEDLWRQGVRTKTPVDMRQAYIGLHVELKDGSMIPFDAAATKIPDFKTTSEPAGTPESALTDATKDKVSVDGGKVEAGKSARVYINRLKDACKGDKSCFWYGYVYSEPAKLTGPDGSPFLTVQKDDAGKYYVDVQVPDGLTGEHRIALTDETGALQGWTTVKAEAPASVAVYRLFNPYMTSGTTHLFTTSKAEYDKLVAAGWQGEDVKFHAAGSAANGAKPVYRLYNRYDGSHHFTVDAAEKDNLVKIGWTLEPTTWWAPADGDAKVYRLYNRWNGEHLFTTDKAESDRLAGLGWTVEESGFSVYSQAK